MEKNLYIGKFKGYSVILKLSIEEIKGTAETISHETIHSYKTLNISGTIRNYGGGQIQKMLRQGLSEYAIDPNRLERILAIWDEYHLNDLNECCEHQTPFPANADNRGEREAIETAKCPNGYKYGSKGLVRIIPNHIFEETIALFEGEDTMPEDKKIAEVMQ